MIALWPSRDGIEMSSWSEIGKKDKVHLGKSAKRALDRWGSARNYVAEVSRDTMSRGGVFNGTIGDGGWRKE